MSYQVVFSWGGLKERVEKGTEALSPKSRNQIKSKFNRMMKQAKAAPSAKIVSKLLPAEFESRGNTNVIKSFVNMLYRYFEDDPYSKMAQNSVTTTPVSHLALVHDIKKKYAHPVFSIQLDDWQATDQGSSGRCWIFASLNTLRPHIMQEKGVKDFEFSQNWVMFWNKFEQVNIFLDRMQRLSAEPLSDRRLSFLLAEPINDGGQWGMFVNIAQKYGLVPKGWMPETNSSMSTAQMNSILAVRMRQGAQEIRKAAPDAVGNIKKIILSDIWKILCIHLGTPPTRVAWRYLDKDRKLHENSLVTPLEFMRSHIKSVDLNQFVCMVHDPRETSEYYKTYTVEFINNVVGMEKNLRYVNCPIQDLKESVVRMLRKKRPVWMACDVGKMFNSRLGIMDKHLYDFESLDQMELGFADKRDRIVYRQTCMNHAMVFTGVDLDSAGKPVSWRVENSWGSSGEGKGFLTMSDDWFTEYMFEIVVHVDCVSEKVANAKDLEPVVLAPWDAMGSVACL